MSRLQSEMRKSRRVVCRGNKEGAEGYTEKGGRKHLELTRGEGDGGEGQLNIHYRAAGEESASLFAAVCGIAADMHTPKRS